MRRHQHVGQFMERAPRWPPLRLGLGGILPPYIKRGAAQVTVLKRGVKRILIDDRRPRDIDQQRPRLHQGKPAGIDQSCRLRRKRASDQDGVAQRQHAIEVGQRENGFGRRGIGHRAAVGSKDAAFKSRRAFGHLAPDPAVADDADGAPQDFTMRAVAAKLWARDPRARAERRHRLEQAMSQDQHRRDDVFGDRRFVAEHVAKW